MSEATQVDAAVVGGGPAGLSAALTLARAGRQTIVFDGGAPRNAVADHSHGFLTRDGASPEELGRLGREEVASYGGTVQQAVVTDAERTAKGFRLTLDTGEHVEAHILILATGVVDELPDIPGLAEAWGASAIHCPYCHGHEHRQEPTVLLCLNDTSFNEARLLRGWTNDLTVIAVGTEYLDDEQEAALVAEGTRVVRTPVARLHVVERQIEAVELEDGSVLPCRVFYLQPPQRQRSGLGEQLGLDLSEKGCLCSDFEGRTDVPGLFVVGDASDWPQSIAVAVAEGSWAGMAANYDLVVGSD